MIKEFQDGSGVMWLVPYAEPDPYRIHTGTDITQNIETISSTELHENLIQPGGLTLGPEIEVLPFYPLAYSISKIPIDALTMDAYYI